MNNKENETNKSETKICKKCQIEKTLDNFYKVNKSEYREGTCKECKRIARKNHTPEERERRKINNKKSYLKCIDKRHEEVRAYYHKHKEERKEIARKGHDLYYLNNKEKIRKWQKEYMEKWREERKKKYKTDINLKLRSLVASRFNSLFKNVILKKNVSDKNPMVNHLGCSIADFRSYIENKFYPEMTWDNHWVVWELDHKIGCCNFNLIDVEEQKKCFHYTNLQPLFKTTDIAKSFGYFDVIGNRNKKKRI